MSDSLASAFGVLSSLAVVYSAVSALFGVYFVLFVLAIWATSRRKGESGRRLSVVTWLLFIDLLVHYITRGIALAEARKGNTVEAGATGQMIPLLFFGSITVTIAGLLSDGLVAWRCYVLYERRAWVKYGPATVIVINALLGFAGDFQYLFVHGNALQTSNHLLHSAFKISAVWGYCMLALNAALTGAIIGKILHAARRVAQQSSCEYNGQQYMLIVEAVIESALVNFLGILLYEIATFAPTGNVEVTFGVGYVFFCILPIFFGISQCLITVRLCLLEKHPSRTPSARRIPIGRTLESSISGRSLRTLPDDLEIPRITFAVHGHEYCRYGLCVAKNTDNMLPCPMAFDDPKRGPF